MTRYSSVDSGERTSCSGGSSGRLRRELGVLPPGDFRNCIAALANDESLITRLFQYRFAGGDDLRGHSFGNLFISAMAGITGSFESALKESSRVLAVQGQVLPSTLEAVTLCADVQQTDGLLVRVCVSLCGGSSMCKEPTGRRSRQAPANQPRSCENAAALVSG